MDCEQQLKIDGCNFSDDVLYHVDSNTWVKTEGELATVGVNTLVAWAFGQFSSVRLKNAGSMVARGESLGSMESPRHFDVVRSPVSGTIVQSNEELDRNPGLLNRVPYGKGWLVKVRPSNLKEESTELKPLSSVADQLGLKLKEMRVRCFQEFPDFEMYEIGTECSAAMAKLDELIERQPVGTVVHLVSDDPTAGIEMVGWSDRTGNLLLEERREGNLEHFIVKKR